MEEIEAKVSVPLRGFLFLTMSNRTENVLADLGFRPLTGIFVFNYFVHIDYSQDIEKGFRPLTGIFVFNIYSWILLKHWIVLVSVPLRGFLFLTIRDYMINKDVCSFRPLTGIFVFNFIS